MTKLESSEILHDRLIRRIAEAHINGDKDTFEYASQIFDQIKESRLAKALAQQALNLQKRIGLDGNPLDKQSIVESKQFHEPIEVDLSIYENIPNRRESLSAINTQGIKVYFNHSIARKLYRCQTCREDINIGSEHVIMGCTVASKRNHHHLHRSCFQTKILPTLKKINIQNPSQTTAAKINTKCRKLRSRQRAQAS